MRYRRSTGAISTNMILSFAFLSTLIAVSSAANRNCYNRDGTDRNDDSDVAQGSTAYVPCNQVNEFSMCCRYGGDDCRPDGLCQGHASDGSKPIWRESCTDQTWDSPYCLKLCISGQDDKGNHYNTTDVVVHQCPDESWCCGSNNSTCCGTSEAKWIVNGKVTSTNPSSIPKGSSSPSSTSSTSSSSSSSTNSATGVAGQDASPTPGPVGPKTPAGAIAGGVVGGVVVLGLLAGTIVFFRRRAKNDRQTHTSASNTHNQSPHAQTTSRTMSEAPQYGNKEAEKFASEAAGTERYEIGHQAKEKPWRQELE